MDKIREALELGKSYVSQVLQDHDLKYDHHPATEADRAAIVEDVLCFDEALALLYAHVASDAREPGKGAVEIAAEIQRQIDEWIAGPKDGRTFQSIAARLIESALREAYHAGLANMSDNFAATIAERARKAREEEREACAERAVAWQKALCKADGWTCKTCTECDQLRAAIKEAGND